MTGLMLLAAQLSATPAPHPAPSPKVVAAADDAAEVAQAKQLVSRLQSQLAAAVNARDQAVRANDELMLTCVDNNEVVVKGLLRTAEEASKSLDLAIRSHDHAGAVAASQRIAEVQSECDQNAGTGQCTGTADVKPRSKNEVNHPHWVDDPTDDCDILGLQNCQTQPIEPVAWASPFRPD